MKPFFKTNSRFSASERKGCNCLLDGHIHRKSLDHILNYFGAFSESALIRVFSGFEGIAMMRDKCSQLLCFTGMDRDADSGGMYSFTFKKFAKYEILHGNEFPHADEHVLISGLKRSFRVGHGFSCFGLSTVSLLV